jgi:DNA-binding beta-propeller fold protein YncE
MLWNLKLEKMLRSALVLICMLLSLQPAARDWRGGDESENNDHRRARSSIVGRVQVANEPAAGWRVELHEGNPKGSRRLGTTTSGGDGKFRLRVRSLRRDSILYLVAKNGREDRLLAVLGPPWEVPRWAVINELSTVASIWTAAQFLDGESIQGNRVGLVAAARNVPNLVDLETGRPGAVVQNVVNGTRTNTLATLNTLASILADCLVSNCSELFVLATLPGKPAPTNTLEAFHSVALNPWHNVVDIFELRGAATDGADDNPVFIPTLLYPPTGWTLSLVYAEGGFNAPGGMSIDARGNLWTNNNFMPGSQSILSNSSGPEPPGPITYFGTGVTKLSSNGTPLSPPTGFLGGGTFGAAFGLAIDEHGHVFVANFAGDSVSELRPDGTPVSPNSSTPYGSDGGYHHASFDDLQSIIVDRAGNIWVSNLGGDSVSQLVRGNPGNVRTWGPGCPSGSQFSKPWGLASDQQGRIWVTNFGDNTVAMIDPATATAPPPFCPSATYDLGTRQMGPPGAQGVAVDFDGNVWVARTEEGDISFLDASDGFASQIFDADDTSVGPWGIAIDGANNVWVADFFGKRILNLCGTSASCPQGSQNPGDRISPPGRAGSGNAGEGGGYGANGALQSITSVVIDQAGNVWVANNFDDNDVCLEGSAVTPKGAPSTVVEERMQPQCGGNGAVVVFGIAVPVATPLIGPPVRP